MDAGGSTGIWRLAVLGLCLVGSAFFSASETALFTIGKIRVKSLVENGEKNAAILSKMLDDADRLLSAVLIGNNLVNILASAVTTSLAISFFRGNTGAALGFTTGVMTLVILLFGEITPKTLGMKHAERLSLFFAKPLYAVMVILSPLVFVLHKVTSALVALLSGKSDENLPTYTENELKNMVEVSHEEGVLNVDEKEMLHNVFEFGDGELREIMTPRIHVETAASDAGYSEITEVFKGSSYSRIPITKPGSDEIIGVLNIRDIAFITDRASEFKVSDYMRPVNFVYEFNNIAKVFSEMRRERVSMSVVLDEYGVMVGVVTTEDFIEEIVGDINDEYDDTENLVKPVGDNEYIVDGSMAIDEFAEAVGVMIETEDFDSIGGFVLGELEDFPAEGDEIRYGGAQFTVEKVANNRIETLRVKTADPE